MELIRYQPFDGSLRATALTLPGTAWQIWDTYIIGMTARSFSGSHLVHTPKKEIMNNGTKQMGISAW